MPSARPTPNLELLAQRAADGDEASLDTVVRALQDPVYGLCLRMLGSPEDARDAAQEILIRIVTRLSSFRGDSKLTTWAYRIAANHLIDLRRRPREAVTFEQIDADLGLPAEPIEPALVLHAPAELLVEETFLGCTLALLRCLDRGHRLAFILGVVLQLDGAEAAAVLEISPAAYRKRLSRAKQRLEEFLRPRCGVVNPDASCRCAHQVNLNARRGLLDPQHLRLVDRDERERARAHIREVREVIDSVELFHRHPDVRAPGGLIESLRSALRPRLRDPH